MRDRVFFQGRVTVVAILFRSVLTAHALFHTNEDPMRVLMLNPPPPPCIPNSEQCLLDKRSDMVDHCHGHCEAK